MPIDTVSRNMDALHHAHTQLGTHVSAIGLSMQRDTASANESVRAQSAAALQEHYATAQYIANTNTQVQALAQQTQEAVNQLTERARTVPATTLIREARALHRM